MGRISFFVLMLLPMLAMFFFLRELLQTKNNSQLLKASFVGAVFYVFNLYYMHMIMDEAVVFTYLFVPLLLYIFLRGIRKKQIFVHAIYFAIASFFYAPVNPNSYVVGPMFITIFIAYYLIRTFFIKDFSLSKKVIQFILLIVVFSFLTNIYWLLPYSIYLKSGLGSVQAGIADWLVGVSKYTSFFNVVRLMGAWDWFESWNKEQYLPYAGVYLNSPLMLLTFVPVLFILIGLWKGKSTYRYFFLGFAVFGILLAMGSNSPVFYFFYKHVPFFWIFRSPWYKFSFYIAFSYAFFIALFTQYMLTKWKNKRNIIIIILSFLILAHPLIIGNRIIRPSERYGNLPALQVAMPSYVFDSANWFNQQKNDERIMMVPQVAWESTAYEWAYGNLMVPLFTLNSKNPVITLPYDRQGPGVDLLKAYKLSLYNPDSTPSANFLAYLNVRYVVNQKDFSYYYFRAPENAKVVEKYLSQDNSLKKIRAFGAWDIYENKDRLSKIYGTTTLVKVKNIEEVGKLDITQKPAFIMADNKLSISKLKEGKVTTSFHRNSPTSYTVSIKTDAPFYLVFNEAYHSDWKLYLKDQEIPTKHFVVNSYGNGYVVNKTGEYTLEIRFLPQKYFKIGYVISCTILISLLVFVFIRRLKNKYRS